MRNCSTNRILGNYIGKRPKPNIIHNIVNDKIFPVSFRRTISIPVLDHLLLEMETRFDKHQQTAVQGPYLVPSLLFSKTLEEVSPKIQELGDLYKDDLPFHSSLSSEFHCWYMKWRDQEKEHGSASLPTTLYHTLPQTSFHSLTPDSLHSSCYLLHF